eukprot:m.86813 g.86813  ORF g.86813 m.86813 type:complete len:185 (-) comp12815_c1_seq1:852-1406(-)
MDVSMTCHFSVHSFTQQQLTDLPPIFNMPRTKCAGKQTKATTESKRERAKLRRRVHQAAKNALLEKLSRIRGEHLETVCKMEQRNDVLRQNICFTSKLKVEVELDQIFQETIGTSIGQPTAPELVPTRSGLIQPEHRIAQSRAVPQHLSGLDALNMPQDEVQAHGTEFDIDWVAELSLPHSGPF